MRPISEVLKGTWLNNITSCYCIIFFSLFLERMRERSSEARKPAMKQSFTTNLIIKRLISVVIYVFFPILTSQKSTATWSKARPWCVQPIAASGKSSDRYASFLPYQTAKQEHSHSKNRTASARSRSLRLIFPSEIFGIRKRGGTPPAPLPSLPFIPRSTLQRNRRVFISLFCFSVRFSWSCEPQTHNITNNTEYSPSAGIL